MEEIIVRYCRSKDYYEVQREKKLGKCNLWTLQCYKVQFPRLHSGERLFYQVGFDGSCPDLPLGPCAGQATCLGSCLWPAACILSLEWIIARVGAGLQSFALSAALQKIKEAKHSTTFKKIVPVSPPYPQTANKIRNNSGNGRKSWWDFWGTCSGKDIKTI